MGNSTSKTPPPVIAELTSPMYRVKKMGSRHILLAGGGGAAKTGVANTIEAHLLTFDPRQVISSVGMRAKLCTKLHTDPFATMNMDVVATASQDQGKYLIAAGHDQYCDIYESIHFAVEPLESGSEDNLTFKLRHVARLTTDDKIEGGYQKCVRFDRSTSGARLVTGGADGHMRIWNMKNVVENRDASIRQQPITDIAAHDGDIDDIDISPDGRIIISVGYDGKIRLWDKNTGGNILDLPKLAQLEKFKARSVRFSHLGENNILFVAAYNQIQRTSKCACYLVLWAFNHERKVCRPIIVNEAAKGGESISTLCLSQCGNFTGVGTLGGSVGVFDTNDMKCLYWSKETHGIFVTDVEFLDRRATDITMSIPNGQLVSIPGAAASARASLVSLSADQTVQLHNVPFELSASTTEFLVKLSLFLLLINLCFYFLF